MAIQQQPNNQMDDLNSEMNEEERNQYLLFYLAEELYAAPLLQVKEIVKLLPAKKVPFMKPYFKGLINLRGQVVSVVDLRMKLSINTKNPNNGLVMIIETVDGFIGVIIDDLHSVHKFEKEEINVNTTKDGKKDYFYGVARLDDKHLVNIIDMTLCVSNEDLKLMNEAKASVL